MASGHVNRASKAEHTGAPTNSASVKKVLANSEPSTHGQARGKRSRVLVNDPEPNLHCATQVAPQHFRCAIFDCRQDVHIMQR